MVEQEIQVQNHKYQNEQFNEFNYWNTPSQILTSATDIENEPSKDDIKLTESHSIEKKKKQDVAPK